MAPNFAVMDWKVANTGLSPRYFGGPRFHNERAGQLSDAELAKAMGVDRLYIAKAVYNTANEGQTDGLGAVWGKHIVFGVAPQKLHPTKCPSDIASLLRAKVHVEFSNTL